MRIRRRLGLLPAALALIYGWPGHVEDGQWWLKRLGMFGEGQTTWLWWNYALVSVSVLIAFYAVLPDRILKRITWSRMRTHVSEFDMPIRDAINHLAQTIPHSFQDSGRMERHFFRMLHREMCAGRLPVIGMNGESGSLKHISARKCKRLKPMETVVPRNPLTPHGVRFSLICLPTDRGADGVEFLGLRVRSWDLYQIWPK